jgi:hypothetical protein
MRPAALAGAEDYPTRKRAAIRASFQHFEPGIISVPWRFAARRGGDTVLYWNRRTDLPTATFAIRTSM